MGPENRQVDPDWRRGLRRVGIDIRPGEGSSALLLFLSLFLILAFQISTKTVRQAVFIEDLGATRLPWVYLLVALAAYPALRVYGRMTGRLQVDYLLVVTSVWVGVGLLGFWALWAVGGQALTMVFYVGSSIVYALLISQFWMLANHVFDARQARRLFAFVGAGGLLGAIFGGQIASLVSRFAGTRAVLPVAAALLAVLAVMIVAVGRHRLHGELLPSSGPLPEPGESGRWGFGALRRSRLLSSIAGVLILATMVGQIVDLQFNWAIEQSTVGLDRRTESFGNFFTLLGASAFVFQVLLTGRILKRSGVGFAMRILPVFLAVGTVPLVASSLISPETLLLAALALKLGESGLRYSIDQSARELLFLPIPAAQRRQAKAFIDVVCQRGAKGLAALLLLPVAFGWMNPLQAGWISLALILAWLAVAVLTHREYVGSFRSGLALRTVDAEVPIDLRDARTLEILVEALSSADPRPVLHSLEILHRNDRGHLVPPLLLYHDHPDVRRLTLEILAAARRDDAVHLVERRLGDEHPEVRAEAIRALASLRRQDACDLMLPRLEESDASVRAAAVACLVEHGGEEEGARAARVLAELLADADPATRIEGAKALGALREPRGRAELFRLIHDPDAAVAREAIAAVRRRTSRDGQSLMYVATLVGRLSDRRVRHEVQATLLSFGAAAVPSLAHFLEDPDEPAAVREALPGVLARINAPEAAEELMRALERDGVIAGDSAGPGRRRLIEAMLLARRLADRKLWEPRRLYLEVVRDARAYGLDLARLRGLDEAGRADLSGPIPRWPDPATEPDLLDRLLAERLETRLWCLFSLLSLAGDTDDFRVAYHGLTLGGGRYRARAHELLANALPAEVRGDVLAIVDDAPIDQRLERVGRRLGVTTADRRETLRALLVAEAGDEDHTHLAAAALYAIRTSPVAGLEREIESLAAGGEADLVGETARWVLARGLS